MLLDVTKTFRRARSQLKAISIQGEEVEVMEIYKQRGVHRQQAAWEVQHWGWQQEALEQALCSEKAKVVAFVF